jgi:PIN domain nuclease of toxin-antitoxin system
MTTILILLDSQVVLWLLDDNPKLSKRARELITATGGAHVSVATIWELTIKAMLGKVALPEKLTNVLTEQGLLLMNITVDHVEGLRDYPELTRHDPFDRLLVAQAGLAGMRLLTADRVLLDLGRDFIVDATT